MTTNVELQRRFKKLHTLPGYADLEIAPRQWWGWEEARAFARSLGFTSKKQWCKGRVTLARPRQLPSHPGGVYTKEWRGYADFLGTGNPSRKQW